MKKILIPAIILTFITIPCCRKAPAAIPQGEWKYDIVFNGTVIGSAVKTDSLEGNNFKSEMYMEMNVGTIKNSSRQVVVETTGCEPVSLEYTSSIVNGKDTQTTSKKFTFNGREVKGVDDGRVFTTTIDRPFYLEGNYFIREMIRNKFKTGTQVEGWLYDPMEELDKPSLFRMRLKNTDTVTVGNKDVKVYILEETAHYKNILWYVDGEGVVQKVVISMLNNRLELVLRSGLVKSTREAAPLNMKAFTIRPDNMTQAVYSRQITRYELASTDADFSLPATATQRIIEKKSSASGVSIIVESGPGNASVQEQGQYLEATRYLDYDSPEMIKVVERFRNSSDPVRDIERFVHNHITDKLIGIPLLPASRIYAGRAGDCTEHAVLSIALLRSLGIPSRAVVGMILVKNFSGNRDVFVYHMWTEAMVNGRWQIVDATRPGDIHPSRYIALAYHNLKTEMPGEYLEAVSSVQNMTVKVMQ